MVLTIIKKGLVINMKKKNKLLSIREFANRCMNEFTNKPCFNYTICNINVNNFMNFNLLYGFEKGDEFLKFLGEVVFDNALQPIFISQWYADNFVVLINSDQIDRVQYFISTLNIDLSNFYEKNSIDIYVSFHIGVFTVVDKNTDIMLMVENACCASKLASSVFNSSVTVYDDEMQQKREDRHMIISSMYSALKNEEFVPYLQAKVKLDTGEIVGAEVLARWLSAKHGVIYPQHFIETFEENEFIEILDYYMLRRTFDLVTKYNLGNIVLSVNLSGVTLLKPDFVYSVVMALQEFNIDLAYTPIEIELTESAFIKDSDEAITIVEKLRAMGFLVSVDDFGSGMSSLSRLGEIPTDTIKIDKSFVDRCTDGSKGKIIVKNIVNMAKEMNIETIVEGVETVEQRELLANIGCNVGQGYLFSKPLPVDEFIALLN